MSKHKRASVAPVTAKLLKPLSTERQHSTAPANPPVGTNAKNQYR